MIAMGMVFPVRRMVDEEDVGDPVIVPIAMPFIAGPSTISRTLLLAEKYDRWTVAMAIYAFFGHRGSRAMERLMGMLLDMMSVQMVLDEIQAYLSATAQCNRSVKSLLNTAASADFIARDSE